MEARQDTPTANAYADRVKIYDVEYTDTYDLPFWERLAGDAQSILELPSGSGRRSLFLARLGKQVTSVDLEPGMIALLREKLAAEPSPLAVEPLVGDMRTLDLGKRVDAVFVIREAFQFLLRDAEIVDTLRRFADHLSPHGFMAIDLADFDACSRVPGYHLGYFDSVVPDDEWIGEWRRATPAGGVCSRWRRQHREAPDVIRIEFHYEHTDADGRRETWDSAVTYRRHDKAAFLDLIARAGLSCERIYGNYEFAEHGPGDPRMIFIIRQPADQRPGTTSWRLRRENVTGWLPETTRDFDNTRAARELGEAPDMPLDAERLRYFRTYAEKNFCGPLEPGLGTEEILGALANRGTIGDWLDLGAGTSTLFWTAAMHDCRSITAVDVSPEALAVLREIVAGSNLPRCYRDVLSLHGRDAGHTARMRALPWRYLVFDFSQPWPAHLLAPAYDLMTAFGCFGIADGPGHFRRSLAQAAPRLAAGGTIVGANWLRTDAAIRAEGYDTSFLTPDFVGAAMRRHGVALEDAQVIPIASSEDRYKAILVWVGRKSSDGGGGHET